jgi:hypothetical protein
MGTEQESKSTRFSRWRERRRREKVRASEIKRELKTERARLVPDGMVVTCRGTWFPALGCDLGA